MTLHLAVLRQSTRTTTRLECLEDRYYNHLLQAYQVNTIYNCYNDCLLIHEFVCFTCIDPVPIAGCTLTCIIAIVIGKLVFDYYNYVKIILYYNLYNVSVVVLVLIVMVLVIATVAVVTKIYLIHSNTGKC